MTSQSPSTFYVIYFLIKKYILYSTENQHNQYGSLNSSPFSSPASIEFSQSYHPPTNSQSSQLLPTIMEEPRVTTDILSFYDDPIQTAVILTDAATITQQNNIPQPLPSVDILLNATSYLKVKDVN